jgi:Tfp pilus assembly protein FimT
MGPADALCPKRYCGESDGKWLCYTSAVTQGGVLATLVSSGFNKDWIFVLIRSSNVNNPLRQNRFLIWTAS